MKLSGDRSSLRWVVKPPSRRNGIAPLIAALVVGGVRAGVGAIQANQRKQRQKGYISQSADISTKRLAREQRLARESEAESLGARGLLQGGSGAINAAMVGDAAGKKINVFGRSVELPPSGPVSTTGGGTDLASSITTDTGQQMALERRDLSNKIRQAYRENKDQYTQALLGSVASGVETGASVYGAGKNLSALKTGGVGGGGGLGGVDGPGTNTNELLSATSFGGINPVDPLGDPSSAWNPANSGIHQMFGVGQPNYLFNAG